MHVDVFTSGLQALLWGLHFTTSPQITVWKLLLATSSTLLFPLKGFITKNVFGSPSCCFKPASITFFCWTKQLLVAIDFYSIFSHTMDINSYQHFLVMQIHVNIFCVSTEERNSHRLGKTWVNHDAIIS